MPRLTKEMRQQIVASVMGATNRAKDIEKLTADTAKIVRKKLESQLPKGFLAATANLPESWFMVENSQSLGADRNPVMLAECGNPNGFKGQHFWMRRQEIKFDPLRRPASHWFPIRGGKTDDNPGQDEWLTLLAKQIERGYAIFKKYDAVRVHLEAYLAGCTTTEQVLDGMPELARHIPKPPAKAMPIAVVPSALRASLTGTGFDNGAE